MMRRHPSHFRAVVESLESRLLLSSSMLHTVGNHLEDASGQAVRLTGVNIPSLEWSSTGEHLSTSVPEALNNWNANVIRLPVSEDTWLGSGGAAYKAIVDGIVAQANAANAYVVLDMHEYTQPDANSEAFWTDAATRYKNNPTVLFGLLNEPHGTTWDVWKNGDATHPGMQDLVDTVRNTGANNIVVAGGLDYAYADDGVIDATTGTASTYALSDPAGNGIMYDAHIYPWKSYWVQHVGAVANLFPVIVGEVGHPGQTTYPGIPGSFEADSTWVPKVLEWIDTLNLNWTGWAFYPSANPPGLPSMITDWNYTPTSYWGAPAKAKLLSYDDTVSQRVLGGTVITDSADMAGRFVFSRGATYAFGDVSKFYQSSLASGGWVGLDLGRPATITQINYMPRYDSHGTAAAMLGGVFEASNTPDFSSGVVTLATITSAPVSVGNVYTTANVTTPGAYRYVRYVGPDNQYSQVDELRFFGTYQQQVNQSDYTYTGPATSAVWNNAANWGGAGVPGAGDTANFNATTVFSSFDGQSAGVINASSGVNTNLKLSLSSGSSGQSFTMDNNGAAASITADQLYLTNVTLNYSGDLNLDVHTAYTANELGLTGNTTISGDGTLAIDASEFGLKIDDGVVLDVDRLDLSGTSRIRAAHHNLPDLSGVEVILGTAQIRADWTSQASFAGLDGSYLEMDSSYQLFGTTPDAGEDLQVASWKVGSTQLPAGTYDASSGSIGDANFATIFAGAGANMSITVAAATEYTYSGPATSAAWNDANNWGGVGVPGAGDTANFTATTVFSSFDGQSAGVINASSGVNTNLKLSLNSGSSGQTFTMDNNGAAPSITADQLYLTNVTLNYSGDLSLDANTPYTANELGLTGNTTISGDGTLSINASEFGLKIDDGVVLDVSRLDLSGTGRLRAAHHSLPDLSGVEVILGTCQIRADWTSEASFAGLDGSFLVMDDSYQLFGTTPDAGENLQVASWKIGSTDLGPGTYNASSGSIGDANFATIFAGAGANMSITVAAQLRAAEPTVADSDASQLTAGQLMPIVTRAEHLWERAGYAPSLFADVDIQIADLPGNLLSEQYANTIVLDVNAAGYGWFIDRARTPRHGVAVDPDRFDLLTAVSHELGHLVGLEHTDADAQPVMNETLALGQRILPHRTFSTATLPNGTDQAWAFDHPGSDDLWSFWERSRGLRLMHFAP